MRPLALCLLLLAAPAAAEVAQHPDGHIWRACLTDVWPWDVTDPVTGRFWPAQAGYGVYELTFSRQHDVGDEEIVGGFLHYQGFASKITGSVVRRPDGQLGGLLHYVYGGSPTTSIFGLYAARQAGSIYHYGGAGYHGWLLWPAACP